MPVNKCEHDHTSVAYLEALVTYEENVSGILSASLSLAAIQCANRIGEGQEVIAVGAYSDDDDLGPLEVERFLTGQVVQWSFAVANSHTTLRNACTAEVNRGRF
jgi:hypothetical protein